MIEPEDTDTLLEGYLDELNRELLRDTVPCLPPDPEGPEPGFLSPETP